MNRIAKFLLAAFVAGATLISGCGWVDVTGSEVAVVEDLDGPQKKTLGPGWHWLWPTEDAYKYQISDQVFRMTNDETATNRDGPAIVVKSKDRQKVWINVTFRYSLDRTEVLKECGENLCGVHIEARDQYETKWIGPVVTRVLQDTATEYSAGEIYAEKRAELNNKVEGLLAGHPDLGKQGIIAHTFVMDGVDLEDAYEAQISATVIEEQKRKKAEAVKATAEMEAQAVTAQAQANVNARTQEAEAKKIEQVKQAEASKEASELRALGLLAEGKAKAEVDRLQREALYDGVAGARRAEVEIAKARADAAKGLFPQATVVGGTTVESALRQLFGTGTN